MDNNIKEEEEEEEEEEKSDENNDEELEKDFFIVNKKSGKFTVSCGRKGSGESWQATNYISISYLYNLYGEYHFILSRIFLLMQMTQSINLLKVIKYHNL